MDNADPLLKNRIKLQVPQVLGQEISNWAFPVNPVNNNSNHPDHMAHLAADVAALLLTHGDHTITVSGSTGSGGTPSHSHSFNGTTTVSHTNNHKGNSLQLTHPHVATVDTVNLWNDIQETNTVPEHTPHRLVPALDQGVWVMFEGGDPNFPLWVGVF